MRTALDVPARLILLASLLVFSVSAHAQQGRPMNIDNHCKFMYGSKASAVMGSRSDASSWSCRSGGGLTPVNMDRLCELDYGKAYHAVNADPADAYTWSCVSG